MRVQLWRTILCSRVHSRRFSDLFLYESVGLSFKTCRKLLTVLHYHVGTMVMSYPSISNGTAKMQDEEAGRVRASQFKLTQVFQKELFD